MDNVIGSLLEIEYHSYFLRWMHIDSSNYGEAKVGVATGSGGICDPYNYVRSFQPLGFQSRDMGLFKDTDGSGYLLSEDVCTYLHEAILETDDGLSVNMACALINLLATLRM